MEEQENYGRARLRVEREELRQRKRLRASQVRTLATLVASVGALLSAVLAFSIDVTGDRLVDFTEPQSTIQRRMVEQQKQLDQLRRDFQRGASNASHPGSPPQPPEVIALTKRLEAIEVEQRRLSAVVMDSPEKAMAIPLMRRDIEDTKTSQTQVADALKRDIDRVYDLNKWLVGGLAIGVLGLLVRDLFPINRDRSKT